MTGFFLLLLFILMILGIPVAQAIGLSSLVGMAQSTGVQLTSFAGRVFGAVNTQNLIAVPMFLFAGNLMNRGGVTKRLFGFANKLVGWLPGGLCHVNIVASLIFAGMSGSSLADLGGLGTLIASLASLISFQFYRQTKTAQTGRYLLTFTAASVILLVPLLVLNVLIR